MKSLALPSGTVLRRTALILLCAFAFTGCSTVKGWFTSKDKEDAKKANEPAELTEFTPSATVSRLWSVKAGKGEKRLGARQGPVAADGRVYAAAVEGGVHAFDLQTGKSVWHYVPKRQDKDKKDKDIRLSGGPGVGDGLVVVGSLKGDVIALDAATGTEKWRARVPNEVIAAPAIGQGLVFVRSNDGRISAFDATNGERRWFWNRELPTLTVRGNDAPTLGPGFVFVGNDDGTVTALAMADGRPIWDQTVAQPDGRSELERMADVDGSPALDGTTLYVTSFKKQTMALDAPSGRPIWAHDNGGPGRVGMASDRVVVSDPAGTVWALDKNSGSALWSQPVLARRNLTSAAVQGDYAVVGDYDGYLHWLRLSDGSLAARERTGGDPLRASPVVVDGILLVEDTDGEINAYRVDSAPATAKN
ncbi:outer membrane protein assembly factor BamB [Luteimonas aquatica]|uniref:outer membrane protein assembly factor BamB n=1 Tax=Luteimonas aquatica TaxID=450364 RepID=UPI001F58874B|nr:outer membrane protein assembly factor BamB [Luteimonas aquatica]